MRIFERLRIRRRSDKAILRKLFETVTRDLLEKLDDGAPVPILPDDEMTPRSCRVAGETVRHPLAKWR